MEERTVGDYRLIRQLGEDAETVTWLAEQTSVRREVTVIELRHLSRRESFLADTRARASVDHPLIGSVYEAISDDGVCLVAMERLAGETLSERLAKGATLLPVELAHLLRLVSEAMIHLLEKGSATAPLTPADIHFDGHGMARLANIARSGEPDPEAESRDVSRLGHDLQPLVPAGRPGASRALTVLAWMRGEGLDSTLTWRQVGEYGEQIENQLVDVSHAKPSSPSGRVRSRSRKLPALLGGAAGLAIAVAAVAMMLRKGEQPPAPPPPQLPADVAIPGGSHPTPDGANGRLGAFRISACEVTIGQYLEFLETLELLEPGSRTIYDAKDQPAEKTGHEPADWSEMLAAARSEGTWQGRPIDLFCPVVNVDWWDAAAYCDWKSGRLPTQEEWFAALRAKTERPEILQPADWGPVVSLPLEDRTANGLRGMAGSVAEWTHSPAVNPANPLGRKRFVITGASHLRKDNGALAREWTDDRLQRRPDLGFRVVWPSE